MTLFKNRSCTYFRGRRNVPLVYVLALLLAGSFSLGSSRLLGETASPNKLELAPTWRKGLTRRIEIVRGLEEYAGGQLTAKMSTRTVVEITVLEASTSGYVMQWAFGKTTVEGQPQGASMDQNSLVQEILSQLVKPKLLMELDGVGSVKGLKNWQEWKAILETINELQWRQMTASRKLDQRTANILRDQIRSMFASKEKTEAILLKEASLYFLPFGFSFTAKTPIEYEDRLPNLFGGDPFPSKARLTLTQVDSQNARATIEWGQSLAPEETTRILVKTLTEIARKIGKPGPAPGEIPKVIIDDDARYEIDLRAGWPRSMRYTRNAVVADRRRLETVTILDRSP